MFITFVCKTNIHILQVLMFFFCLFHILYFSNYYILMIHTVTYHLPWFQPLFCFFKRDNFNVAQLFFFFFTDIIIICSSFVKDFKETYSLNRIRSCENYGVEIWVLLQIFLTDFYNSIHSIVFDFFFFLKHLSLENFHYSKIIILAVTYEI